ncbi:MAG: hypothetical protein WBD64_03310, partial [Candidatus Zixiibacteriota bacterium]
MKKYVLLSVVGMVLLGLPGSAWAQCPEDGNDPGVCDTLYVECYDPFNYTPPPWQVRFPILITNDIPDPATDSVAGMVIPLTFTSSNPAAWVEIEAAHNNLEVYPSSDLDKSVFRHLPGMDDPQIRNWMMDLSEPQTGLEWDTRILVMHPEGVDFTLVPSGAQDQWFPGGSRVLVGTITLTVSDTTTLCLDTCFYQPLERLRFARSDAVIYIPRHNMPHCATIRDQGCPGQHPNDNGDCDSLNVEIYPSDRYQVSFPAHARFPMRVTNDIPNPVIDSITGMIIQLGYSSSNPAANVWLDPDYNKCGAHDLHPSPDLNRSIFRHLTSMESPQERNWMMDLSEQGTGLDWDTRILYLAGQGMIMCSLVPTGTQDQRFCGGSRVLVATLTFTLEDTTTICLDTTHFPVGYHAF